MSEKVGRRQRLMETPAKEMGNFSILSTSPDCSEGEQNGNWTPHGIQYCVLITFASCTSRQEDSGDCGLVCLCPGLPHCTGMGA